MNSRKPIRRDPVDLMIANTLKAWVEKSPQPAEGRERLLKVAHIEHKRGFPSSSLRTALRGLLLGLSSIPDALVGEPVFETYQRDHKIFSREIATLNLNMMHFPFFYSHTPQLGLFSILL
jgi:hypothetical protein